MVRRGGVRALLCLGSGGVSFTKTVCCLNLYRSWPFPMQGILRRAHLAHAGVP